MMEFMKLIQFEPIQLIYGCIAIFGGVARYLSSFTHGTPFKLSIFLASVFVSGFSGYMFALLGVSMNLPSPFIFMMAGTGGFMGEQSMKFIVEWTQSRVTRG